MARIKKAEDSRPVNLEAVSPEIAPKVPEQETKASPKPQPEGGIKRYKSPTTGLTIEDF